MTESSKPPARKRTSPEYLEDEITQAQRRGDFDNLPGKGKPLQNLSRDPLWWVKDKLKREGASYLPPGLQLRRDKEAALEEILKMSSEARVRKCLEELNDHIRVTNRSIFSGPPSNVMPVDVDAEIARWRQARDESQLDR